MPSGLGMTLIQRFTVDTTTTIISSKRTGANSDLTFLVCNQPITYTINISCQFPQNLADGYISLIDVNQNSIIGGASFSGGVSSRNVDIDIVNGFTSENSPYILKARYDGYARALPEHSFSSSESALFIQEVYKDGSIFPGYLQVKQIDSTAGTPQSFISGFDLTATLNHGGEGFPTVVTINTIASQSYSSMVISTVTNASPIQVNLTVSHGLETGSKVTISGVVGNTAANGVWTITVVSSNNFTLDGSTGNGAYISGGTILCESIVTTAAEHKLLVGQNVRIAGNEVDPFYAGVYTVGVGGFSSTTFSLQDTFVTLPSFLAITNVTQAVPSVITTADVHNLVTGDYVLLENIRVSFGLIVSTEYNGFRKIVRVGPNQFSIDNTTATQAYASGYSERIKPAVSGPIPNTMITDGVIDFYSIVNDGYDTKYPLGIGIPLIGNTADLSVPGFTGYYVVSDASDTTPININTSSLHSYSTGDIVTISGVLGNTAANGVWSITVIDTNNFTLDGSVSNGTHNPGTGFIDSMVFPGPGTYGIQAVYRPDSECYAQLGSDDTFAAAIKSVQISGAISNLSLTASPYIINNVSGNAVPILIETVDNHGFVSGTTDGYFAKIVGVGGNTNANGTFKVNILSYNITGATATSPIEITTSSAHSFLTGHRVTIYGVGGVGGNINANGVWTITKTGSTTFTLDGSVGVGVYNVSSEDFVEGANVFELSAATGDGYSTGNASYTSGGIATVFNGRYITTLTTSTPISVLTSTDHGLTTGDTVTITGSPHSYGNNTWTITVVDSTHFTLDTSTGGAPIGYSGGIVEIEDNILLRADFSNGSPPTTGEISFDTIGSSPALVALGSTNILNRTAVLRVSPDQWTTTGVFTVEATHTPTSKTISNVYGMSTVTTSVDHGLQSGDVVTITGVVGIDANGTWTITKTASNEFSLDGALLIGTYVSGGLVEGLNFVRNDSIDVTI